MRGKLRDSFFVYFTLFDELHWYNLHGILKRFFYLRVYYTIECVCFRTDNELFYIQSIRSPPFSREQIS